ncbi:hypothetical protein LOK49_LG03G00735 [Camellia lanceoleosa]|uniref:Uncharacterized protein n=1 Tax=Camellia lanceoleosa TaxID=1840588 RepID=A0ACC0ICE9_9ERIC|nr:hypothetical protein LOK49_LG03G00735 [Camellia lanceoleosa]
MLSKASSSKFYSTFFFFWFILLMFIILQPITSARKLAGGGPGSKIGMHPSPTNPAHSAIGGGGGGGPRSKTGVHPSPTNPAHSAIGGGGGSPTPITYRTLQKGQPVCNSRTLYGNCAPFKNAPRPCTIHSRCKSEP